MSPCATLRGGAWSGAPRRAGGSSRAGSSSEKPPKSCRAPPEGSSRPARTAASRRPAPTCSGQPSRRRRTWLHGWQRRPNGSPETPCRAVETSSPQGELRDVPTPRAWDLGHEPARVQAFDETGAPRSSSARTSRAGCAGDAERGGRRRYTSGSTAGPFFPFLAGAPPAACAARRRSRPSASCAVPIRTRRVRAARCPATRSASPRGSRERNAARAARCRRSRVPRQVRPGRSPWPRRVRVPSRASTGTRGTCRSAWARSLCSQIGTRNPRRPSTTASAATADVVATMTTSPTRSVRRRQPGKRSQAG